MFLCKHPRQLISKKKHGIGGLGENPKTSKTGWISNYKGVEAVETQISWYNSQSLVSMVTEAPVNFISWQPCKRDRLLPYSLIQSNSVRQASNWSNQQNYPRNSSVFIPFTLTIQPSNTPDNSSPHMGIKVKTMDIGSSLNPLPGSVSP